jgi:hypothetical protein
MYNPWPRDPIKGLVLYAGVVLYAGLCGISSIVRYKNLTYTGTYRSTGPQMYMMTRILGTLVTLLKATFAYVCAYIRDIDLLGGRWVGGGRFSA